MQDVTIIIKTFERPEALHALITSIRERYGDIGILVANDGTKPVEGDFGLYTMPYDSGLSAGRNLLLSQVNTPYFVLMDDDFLVTENTHLEILREHMDTYDLVGGAVEGHGSYNGTLVVENNVLRYEKGEPTEIVLNFFMAHTDKVRQIGWDNELKLAEHTDFFLRAKGKLKIHHEERCSVKNTGGGDENYAKMRQRGTYFACKMMEKHNLQAIINFSGQELKKDDCKYI